MQTCQHEPRLVKIIESCRHEDHLRNCMSWLEQLAARGTIPPPAASRLRWLVSMKLDGSPVVQ